MTRIYCIFYLTERQLWPSTAHSHRRWIWSFKGRLAVAGAAQVRKWLWLLRRFPGGSTVGSNGFSLCTRRERYKSEVRAQFMVHLKGLSNPYIQAPKFSSCRFIFHRRCWVIRFQRLISCPINHPTVNLTISVGAYIFVGAYFEQYSYRIGLGLGTDIVI